MNAPMSWAAMNHGASAGRIPENVLVNDRARVTAGLANEVDAVNQYAPVMYAPTANATESERDRLQPQMTESSPNVATNSLNSCAAPARTCWDAEKSGSPNITKHDVCGHYANECAKYLAQQVSGHLFPANASLDGIR